MSTLFLNQPAGAASPAQSAEHRRWESKAAKQLLPTILEDTRPAPRWALWTTAAVVTVAYLLLWSPYWYPLADSGLYLNLGRSVADGDGFRYMGLPYKRITPLTPWLIALSFKAGGGIGAVHGVMIGLLLLSNLFCFLTLRNWFNERVALLGTIVAATQFWVWRNAIFIMTEPAFLAGFWTGMYFLSRIPKLDRVRSQWMAAVLACLCLIFAYESRAIPTLILIACALAALWMHARKTVPWEQRTAWVAMFVVVFGVLLYQFGKPAEGAEEVENEVKQDTGRRDRTGAVLRLQDRYSVKMFQNVRGAWWQKTLYTPVLAGRWINEGFVSPMVVFFGGVKAGKSSPLMFSIGSLFALTALVFCIVGWVALLMRGHWWSVLLAGYAGPFFLNWFGRVLPRYNVPIAPILFIIFAVGATVSVNWLLKKWKGAAAANFAWVGRLPVMLAALIVLGNVPVYAVELYVRHLSRQDFYDVARQGAMAELVDIGAYLQKNSDPRVIVYANAGGFTQRVGFFLSGRRIEVPARTAALAVKKADAAGQLNNFLQRVPLEARHAIVFVTEFDWPEWHFPLKGASGRTWWQLYERDYDTGELRRVELKKEREYVTHAVPPSGLRGLRLQQAPEEPDIQITPKED